MLLCYEEIIDTRHSLVLSFALSFPHNVQSKEIHGPPCMLASFNGYVCIRSLKKKAEMMPTPNKIIVSMMYEDNSNLRNKTNFVDRFRRRVVTNRERRKSSTREEPRAGLHSSQVLPSRSDSIVGWHKLSNRLIIR